MATRCHLPPGTFCFVSVIAGQAGQRRWQGLRVQTPPPLIFSSFVLIFLHARTHCDPSLALHAGSCGLMDKALVFGAKDCRLESCQDQVFLSAIRCPASLDPMMLLLCEASLCLPSLAWPHLASHFLHCKESTPGQDRTGDLQRVRLMS